MEGKGWPVRGGFQLIRPKMGAGDKSPEVPLAEVHPGGASLQDLSAAER